MADRFAWEVTITEVVNTSKKYKLTRRLPALSIAETKMFKSKEKAVKQFQEWLGSTSS